MTRSRRFLLTMWEGGGTVPPQLGLAARLTAAGHLVHVLGDPTIGARADALGLGFTAWVQPPHRTNLEPDDDVFKDWEAANPLVMLRNARDRFMAGPAAAFADETAAVVDAFAPDLVLADGMILGSMIGAQGRGVPVAAVMPNIWMLPTPGVTPVGPGFQPAKTVLGRARDSIVRRVATRIFDGGLPALNAARSAHGLEPIDHLWDQVLACDRIFLLASRHFDAAAAHVPEHAAYLGPILDDPSWAEPFSYDWPEPDRPLVLVGLSSTFQDQVPLLRRVVAALSSLPVRAVITLGQMVDPDDVTSTSPHVQVVPSAPHGELLEQAKVVVSHCGHGTTMKALASSTPMVCIPMGRDQNDMAARVVDLGAGVRLSADDSVAAIAGAVGDMLRTGSHATAAGLMAGLLATEQRSVDIVGEIEASVPEAPAA